METRVDLSASTRGWRASPVSAPAGPDTPSGPDRWVARVSARAARWRREQAADVASRRRPSVTTRRPSTTTVSRQRWPRARAAPGRCRPSGRSPGALRPGRPVRPPRGRRPPSRGSHGRPAAPAAGRPEPAALQRVQPLVHLQAASLLEQVDHRVLVAAQGQDAPPRPATRAPGRCRRPGRARSSGRSTRWSGCPPSSAIVARLRCGRVDGLDRGPRTPSSVEQRRRACRP